jgi:hypothetical protein
MNILKWENMHQMTTKSAYQISTKYTKQPKKLPNGPKIYHNFPFQDPQKCIKIGIFGQQINHLATLLKFVYLTFQYSHQRPNCYKIMNSGRVTRLGEFSPNGQLLSLAVFLLSQKYPKIFGSMVKGIYQSVIKLVGIHFGRLFHKLIWSHRTLET